MLEKQYGGPVKAMSPIKHINQHYEQLLNKSLDAGTRSKKNSRKAFNWEAEEDSAEQTLTYSPRSKRSSRKNGTRNAKQKSYQGKIPRLLENLHSPVERVSMKGMNSTDQFTIDFVANASGTGVSQVYLGQQPICGGYAHGNSKTHLPAINFDKQTYRRNEFLRTDDDARSERFIPFNQFPGSKEHVADLKRGSSRICQFDLNAKPKYGCHHYMHDPNFKYT